MRRAVFVLGLCVALSADVAAQITVFDPAITARNTATAAVEEFLLNTERVQHSQLRRMAERLSAFTNLGKYAVQNPPRWRAHSGNFLFIDAYNNALTVGDPAGAAFLAVSHPVGDPGALLARLPLLARRVMVSRLATVNTADAAAIAATNDAGHVRFNGRGNRIGE